MRMQAGWPGNELCAGLHRTASQGLPASRCCQPSLATDPTPSSLLPTAPQTQSTRQETSDVQGVMDGDLAPFMNAYLKHRGAQQGAAAAAAAGAPAAAGAGGG